jgi:multiple sugar transport system permease protein
MLGIFIFTAGPVLISLSLSMFRWNVFEPPEYIGLENFQRFFQDTQALTGFANTLKFVVLAVTTQISLALLLALAVQRRMYRLARYYFRTAFFLPLLLSVAAVSVAFGYLFHREFGVVNYYLSFLGISRIPWLNSKDWVLVTIVLTAVWRNFGFTFIIFLGGLTNISREVLDAADVDGAHGWQRLRHIILPLLSPTMLFATVTAVIGSIQVFEEPYIMTRGGPGDASRTAVMVMYEAAFKNIELGYGAVIAVFLFILIMTVTLFQFWLSKRWVFYQ